MNEKTILARLKRKWQGQEKDRIIWNEGIVPNFITLDGIYNPISFTCYQLYKILQESFSYQNLYKYLRKYEIEGLLTSKLIINKNNRKECIYSFSERILHFGIYKIDHIQNKYEKVEAQILFELIQKYNHPKKIFSDYNKKKISKTNALDTLQYIIDQGSTFKGHRLEPSFLLDTLKYFVKLSKKEKSLFSYLEEIAISHEDNRLQKEAFDYILKYFPDLLNTKFSYKFEKMPSWYFSKSETLYDHILTNERLSLYRSFKRSIKQLKDQKLLDFHLLAKEKLKDYRTYISKINYGDYDPLIKCLIYGWGSISVAYNKIKNFEQEPYENILSANLRNNQN